MNKTNNPMSLIDQIRKREQANQAASTFPTNENIIKLKAGNNYAFRLLWLPPIDDKCNRLYPMISQYVHRIYQKGVGESKVYCPTSPYLKGDTPEGYKCPICREVFDLYKESTTSPSAKQIVDTFRRTMVGYIPVYVVQGPVEEKGKVRILQYTKSFHDFFYSQIFGIAPKKRKNGNAEDPAIENVDEPLNALAFMYLNEEDELVTTGVNFIVKVTAQKVPINGRMTEVNKYEMKFSHSETDIPGITAPVFKALNSKLKFDEDFYKESSTEELLTFKNKFMSNTVETSTDDDDEVSSDINQIVAAKSKPTSRATTVVEEVEQSDGEENVEDEIPMSNKSVDVVEEIEEEIPPAKKTSKKSSSKVKTAPIVEDENETNDTESSEENVDDFIANLLNKK